jgi:hypothetical protein
MERKPGGTRLVYDKQSRTIKRVRINFWKRLIWMLMKGK